MNVTKPTDTVPRKRLHSPRSRRKLANKLISVWWTRRKSDETMRRQIMKLQQYGLPPAAASEALQQLNDYSTSLHAWLDKWM